MSSGAISPTASVVPARAAWWRAPWLRDALFWGVSIAVLLAVFGPTLHSHLLKSLSPRYANNDALQQIYPFFRYEDASLFQNDVIADYYLACLPWGYRLLYMGAAQLHLTEALSKLLPYLGLLVTLAGLGVVTQRLSGKLGAVLVVAMSLSSSLYLSRMAGGLPRTFAYPVLAVAAALLVRGRMRALAVLIPCAAAFYPVSAVVCGLGLALALLVLPAHSRGDASDWSLARRLRLLALSAALSALVVLPTALSSNGYGRVLRPGDVEQFPEVGEDGRYGGDSRAPFESFASDGLQVFERAISGSGRPFHAKAAAWAVRNRRGWLSVGLCAFALGGLLAFMWLRPEARRLAMLIAGAAIGHTIADQVVPYFYLPPRYVLYPVGLLAPVLLISAPAGYLACLARGRAWPSVRALVVALCAAPLLLVFGARGSSVKGLTDQVSADAPLLRRIAQLPKDALIAGWPKGPLDGVPYVTGRKVLLNFETHQAFHEGYTLEMRRRMNALVDAYFAITPEPLYRLRDEFGVTHLVIKGRYLTQPRTPHYFEPFKQRSKALREIGFGNFELLRQLPKGVLLPNDTVLLDLRKL